MKGVGSYLGNMSNMIPLTCIMTLYVQSNYYVQGQSTIA